MRSNIYTDQLVGALIKEGIDQSEITKAEKMAEIIQTAFEKEEYARTALSESLQCVENVRDFASNPNGILGSMGTKHGEIAEHVEVEIRNARDILNGIKPAATFEGVGRTAPEDYIINGVEVQSKYINGVSKSLDHVIEHLHKYPGFTDNGYYHIPKDQYEILEKIYNGDHLADISSKTIRKCQETIRLIENETGKSFGEVVRPGVSTYNEVQLGRIDSTLDGYEKEFHSTTDKKIDDVRQEKQENLEQAQHITDASWGEALKYSAIGAAITGATSGAIKIYAKIKSGKAITQFSLDDWKDVGYDFSKGSIKGGVSSLGIYGLTKVVGISAPFASAIVSSTMGLASLYYDFKNGKISESEYGDAACSLSVEAGLIAIGSAIGQTVIPIPILGAIVGSAVSKSVLMISKHIMGEKEKAFIEKMKRDFNLLVENLNKECQAILKRIDDYYQQLGGLIEAALNPDLNKRLAGSIALCRFVGVPEEEIIHTTSELDDYMLN